MTEVRFGFLPIVPVRFTVAGYAMPKLTDTFVNIITHLVLCVFSVDLHTPSTSALTCRTALNAGIDREKEREAKKKNEIALPWPRGKEPSQPYHVGERKSGKERERET